ncbi:hypothetical protein [Acaryochloris marina]|nr:hypothetical protein [Acaryochloris marina]
MSINVGFGRNRVWAAKTSLLDPPSLTALQRKAKYRYYMQKVD